jgi:hypothetical protein
VSEKTPLIADLGRDQKAANTNTHRHVYTHARDTHRHTRTHIYTQGTNAPYKTMCTQTQTQNYTIIAIYINIYKQINIYINITYITITRIQMQTNEAKDKKHEKLEQLF